MKDRPCAVVLAVSSDDGEKIVTVLPITHTPPKNAGDGIEIPSATKQRPLDWNHGGRSAGISGGPPVRRSGIFAGALTALSRQVRRGYAAPRRRSDHTRSDNAIKQRLGLDSERSWIVVTEANRFIWPSPDLRPARASDGGSAACGLLPAALFLRVRDAFIAAIRARRARPVPRST